ncbi:MAG: isochorismatase family protein [Gammaproteobacteria bacterium]|nr:isochorismatase family protein [Gammaproteobacteria bacterium]
MRKVPFWSLSAVLISVVAAAAEPAVSAGPGSSVIDAWSGMALPPVPQLKPVTIDTASSALLILDMYARHCIDSQRPRCVQTLPGVRRLLQSARAHKMLVVYSGGPPASTASMEPAVGLEPGPGEPMVRAGADKFLGSDLQQILTEHHIRTVVVVGTSAEGAVLYTASGAALRGLLVVVPVDGMSSSNAFGELVAAWQFQNGPTTISHNVTLTRTSLLTLR